jgi:formate-dependent nitrite reductase cytochrome c552 subunit
LLVVVLAGCSHADRPREFSPAPSAKTHAEAVNTPAKLMSIETDQRDSTGKRLRVACATCHSLRDAGPLPQRADDLKQFHVGLRFEHASMACSSCHVAGRQDQLHLASGQVIAMNDALLLCGQCHGPQLRNYQAGAHGGMNGYWDRSRGPRTRNHCVDCHDPHAPRYPSTNPVFKPNDRIPPNPKDEAHG